MTRKMSLQPTTIPWFICIPIYIKPLQYWASASNLGSWELHITEPEGNQEEFAESEATHDTNVI